MKLKLFRVTLDFNWPRGKPFEGELPVGIGYQMWDEEKSAPRSPVMKTEDGILLWLKEQGYSRKNAREIVNAGNKIKEN